MSYVFRTPFVDYTLHAQSILEAAYKENIPLINKEMAVRIVADRLSLQRGKPCRLLMHTPTSVDFSAPARSYLASSSGTEGIAAAAVLVNHWTEQIALRFILCVKRSSFPMDIFRDRQKAIEWLLERDLGEVHPGAELITDGLQRYDHLFFKDPHAKLTYDHREVITKVNEAFCVLTGYRSDELLGQPFSMLTRDEFVLYDRQGLVVPAQLELSPFPVGRDGFQDMLVVVIHYERVVPASAAVKTYGLKEEDLRILRFLSQGMTSVEIGGVLGKSFRTVDGRRAVICKKLGVRNVKALLPKAKELGLLG
ncbi:helix-turn-helix transcriptional regulator [Dinghuibacter silviterrae]|uniref:PAS domain S-box-containing protein n=1 Tax=Dinghuibacter silviterrae TaxID=1539049 RepID=A0A4R8DV01_9BACT|nr:PAS domain S-box protein [Dinghuibacter silviterrae]TDX01806.1 PAS domain S-box-containing protein [Dinghuibacter silviterrae]